MVQVVMSLNCLAGPCSAITVMQCNQYYTAGIMYACQLAAAASGLQVHVKSLSTETSVNLGFTVSKAPDMYLIGTCK